MGNNKKKKQISLKISTIAFFIIVVIVIINLVYKSELPIVSQFRNSDITTDALADTPPVYPAGEILYLPVTMFKYNTDEFNSLTRAEEGSTQGIYFNNRNGNNTIEIDGNSRISCEAYNHYSSSQTTGMVKNELDSSGNIQFNYPEIGIFDETTNRGKTVYQNVLLPFTSQGNGTYIMDSDNEDINFTNGIPQSGVKLEKNENKNTYNNATEATVWGSRNVNGFFPFNSKNGEDAIYHFGVKTEITFYMSSDGKTKTDLEYVLLTNEEYYDAISEELPEGVIGTDSYIPENSIGTYEDGETQIVNYYYKVKTYTLTVHHYLEGTEVKVPLKGGTEGKVVEDEITEGLIKNEEYTTSKASEDKIDYDIYELVEEPNNANGYIQDNTEVTYYYKVKTASITITKVAEENYQTVLPNTKFKLYRLTNKDSSEKDELINKINPQDCWTLVDEYETLETGKITLPDLPINEEYRLVETKAAGNRLIPDGQWKIEFIYGNYDKEDNTIVRINGTNIRITAIGNPPALAETDSKELLLPNKKMFVFPSSGSLGTKEIYEIGLGIMIAGGIFLITRKALVIIDSNRKEKGLKPLVKIKTKHDRKQK